MNKKHKQIPEILAINIKFLMQKNNISKDELSKKAPIGTATLGVILSKNGNPTLDSLQNIATVLKVHISTLFDGALTESHGVSSSSTWNAIAEFDDYLLRCNILYSDKTPSCESTTLVAFEKNGFFLVKPALLMDKETSQQLFNINNISFCAPPIVAFLDDDESIRDGASAIMRRNGIACDTFDSLDAMDAVLDAKKYDLFIMDWMINIESSSNLIEKIQNTYNSKIPITILTGQLENNTVIESDISKIMAKYPDQIDLIEKPVRPKLFETILRSKLFFSHGVA